MICHYYLLTEISSNIPFHLPFSLSSTQIESRKIFLHVLHHLQESQNVLFLDFYFHLSLYSVGKGSILRDSESEKSCYIIYTERFLPISIPGNTYPLLVIILRDYIICCLDLTNFADITFVNIQKFSCRGYYNVNR